jgi:hypothetical protein
MTSTPAPAWAWRCSPTTPTTAAALLTAADTGIYVSKRGGRGRTSFALGGRHAA